MNGLPDSYEDLKTYIENVDTREEYSGIREDYVQYLLQNKKTKLYQTFNKIKNNNEGNNIQIYKDAVFEYIAIINALKDLGAKHLKDTMEYDPYYTDLELNNIMAEINHKSKELGYELKMPIPKGYDKANPQPEAQINQIINCTNQEINGNPYSNYMWEQIGYQASSAGMSK